MDTKVLLKKLEAAGQRIAELEAIVNVVGSSGVLDMGGIDEQLDYVEVQVDREVWEELQRLRTDKGEEE